MSAPPSRHPSVRGVTRDGSSVSGVSLPEPSESPHPLGQPRAERTAPCEPHQPWTHIDVLLPSVLGTDLGVLYEVQVGPPHGDGCVSTDGEERRRRVNTGTGIATALGDDDGDDDESG